MDVKKNYQSIKELIQIITVLKYTESVVFMYIE